MPFADEYPQFARELDAYYAQFPTAVGGREDALHAANAEHPEWLPYERKAMGYAWMAEHCPVKVFRHCPFYFEVDVGKARTDLGNGGLGGWLRRETFGTALLAQGEAWWRPCGESGLSLGWPVLDDNHLALGLDQIFAHGLHGLIRQAEARLATAETARERAFLTSAIAGHRACLTLARRFAEEAERLANDEDDPAIRARLWRIAACARRVPGDPPATFYEAANTILFMREVTQSLEGAGTSILGHFDRILWPFYQRDVAEGRLTREEAKDLLAALLAFSDLRFGIRTFGQHVGTNTTVGIGGCDDDGQPIFNEITRLILEIYREFRLVDPKLNARISAGHPEEFFQELAELTAAGSNTLAIFNDDVIIPANIRMGKAPADCRRYLGGGCQENVLENTESNNRATMYLNLAQVLLMGFDPARWAWFAAREGFAVAEYVGCADFPALYQAFLANLRAVVEAHIRQRDRTESEGWRYNPCPLHSSTLLDCLANARDITEGGARYNAGSVSLAGIGTLIDALAAVREIVFTRRERTLDELWAALTADFAGDDALHAALLRAPKYGQEDDGILAFSAQVFADVAAAASGQVTPQGRKYEASLFSFRTFVDLGHRTGATPDGRRAGQPVSPGMSPSPLALGRESSIGQLFTALEPLEMTDYPVVAVLDVKLPVASGRFPAAILVSVFHRFLAVGGSVLQLNCVDPATLLAAQADPASHPDLVVRISGYSAYFTTLPVDVQDEVIARTMVGV